MRQNPSIHDLLGMSGTMEDPAQPGGGLLDILGAPSSAPMAGAGGPAGSPPPRPAAPASSDRDARLAMLEQEALNQLHGVGPKRPDMKLKWNEILAAAINPDMLKTIFQRKMEPYHQQMDDERNRREALDRLISVYKMGKVEPEKPTKPQGLMDIAPGGVVFDPQSRQPIFTAPNKPPAPQREQGPHGYAPGSEIIDPDDPTRVIHRVPFRPEKPDQTPEKRQQKLEDSARQYYIQIKGHILSGINSDPAHFGDTPEQKEALAESIASRAHEAFIQKFGGSLTPPTGALGGKPATKPPAVERVKQLDSEGKSKEQIRAILKSEGYDVE